MVLEKPVGWTMSQGGAHCFVSKTHLEAFDSAVGKMISDSENDHESPFFNKEGTLTFIHGKSGGQFLYPARVDGPDIKFHQNSANWNVEFAEIISGEFDLLEKIIIPVRDQMNTQYHRNMMESIEEGVTKVGNVIYARPDQFWESIPLMFEKIEMSCDENGVVKPPQIAVGPKMFEMISKTKMPRSVAEKIDSILKVKAKEAVERENMRRSKFKVLEL